MTQGIDYLETIMRVVAASIAGGLIGLNREKINRPAGLRTHALISLGSCILTILSAYAFFNPDTNAGDPGRIAAQIVSGIGFLGAGTIMKKGTNVKGLTTAATLWVTAALGICFGIGQYYLGLISTILTLIIVVSNKFSKSKNSTTTLEIAINNKENLSKVLSVFVKYNLDIKSLSHDSENQVDIYTFEFNSVNEEKLKRMKHEIIASCNISYIEEE